MNKGELVYETESYAVHVCEDADRTIEELPPKFYGVINKEYEMLEHAGSMLASVLSWCDSLQTQLDGVLRGQATGLDGEGDDEAVLLPEIRTIQ